MAGSKSANRTARTLLLALAALLAVGAIGSLVLGIRATDQAKAASIAQARSIVDDSLTLTLAPGDVVAPASETKADLITREITPVVLDPTAFDTVTIWSTDGTIVYSTDRTLIGQRPEEFRTPVHDAVAHGTETSALHDGTFSVLLPLKLRADAPPSAAIELVRPDDPITAAGLPWRYNAILMTIAFFVVGGLLYRLMRLTAAATQSASFLPASARVAPAPVQPRPIEVPAPGFREEAEARRMAEDRAVAAEERLGVIQEQYRKTLEELHITQKLVHERPQPGGLDPETEQRLLKAEGHARLLEGQLKAMSTERDKLARHIAEQAKARVDPDQDRRSRQVEQEAIGLRAELEGAQTELSVTRRELDALKAQASRAGEMQDDLDALHVEALHAREGMEASQAELTRAKAELEDVRNEMRVLRNEEQRAAVLGEELRSARAELESVKASHRADLVEREADLEDRVRRAREEFQAQLEEQQAQAERQLADRETALSKALVDRETALSEEATQREATLRREAAEREATLTREASEREATLTREASEREASLQHRLAEREATLQQEMSEQLSALEQRLAQREQELTERAAAAELQAGSLGDELRTVDRELAQTRTDLQSAHDELEAAANDGSSHSEQVAKANEELLRSRTEIETLQREMAASTRAREEAERRQAESAREREELQRELTAASGEVQTELTRGVELTERAERAEQWSRSLQEEAARAGEELERVAAERARAEGELERLTRELADTQARQAAEIAAVEARLQPDTDAEEVLRASQERLASQTERLIEVEERAHAAERQLADTIVHLEEVEGELRHLQMEKALHDLQAERPMAEPAAAPSLAEVPPIEDRRASTPFTKELALDAKKSLSHILGLTQIMKYKKDSKDQTQLIKQLTAAARRLDHTVADLAEADALAHGIVDLTIKRTDLEALVKRVVEESGIGEDHDVRVTTEPVVVGVDALRVEQVLAGMLRNASDRTPTGKAITVRLANADGGALLSVEDPEPSSDGSLSPVVQRFVEMQGGWTRIESRDGGGSAFRAFLPDGGPTGEAPAEPGTETNGDERATPAAGSTLQIVVAEPPAEDAPAWDGSEEQLFVQELHQLHAED